MHELLVQMIYKLLLHTSRISSQVESVENKSNLLFRNSPGLITNVYHLNSQSENCCFKLLCGSPSTAIYIQTVVSNISRQFIN